MEMLIFRIIVGVFLSATLPVLGESADEVLKKEARAIDEIITENYKENGFLTPAVVDDATYLRRSFLVAIGRIPTVQEAKDFLDSGSANKRELIIDDLYSSSGYNSHAYNWLYDLLTLRERYGNAANRESNAPLIEWVRDAVDANMPWDEFCRSLLSTKGNAWTDSGAAGYHYKGDAIDDHLSNTLRVFTGVRMECAQCHDDPFQEWEQMDFFQFKAFVNGRSGIKPIKGRKKKVLKKIRLLEQNEPKEYKKNHVGRIIGLHGAILSKASYGIAEHKGSGVVKIPKGYKYDDAEVGDLISARSAYGARVKLEKGETDKQSLAKFASWMTSEDTPQFAQTIALRLWERVMGASLTPINGDYVAPEDTEFEELILHLSELIKKYDYDIKSFQKTLMRTKAFQFKASSEDFKNGAKNSLHGRKVSRMTAEQIWDSLMSITTEDPEALPKRKRTSKDFIYAGQRVMPVSELVSKLKSMNNNEYEEFLLGVYNKLKTKGYPRVEKGSTKAKKKNIAYQLRRASELPTPVPQGHFLSAFGQSHRSAAIDEATQEGTVSHALEIMNGMVQKRVVANKSAFVYESAKEAGSFEKQVEVIFLAALSRRPDLHEIKMCKEVRSQSKNDMAFYQNLLSGLISSQSFYFMF